MRPRHKRHHDMSNGVICEHVPGRFEMEEPGTKAFGGELSGLKPVPSEHRALERDPHLNLSRVRGV